MRIAYCVLRIAYCVLCIAYFTSVGSHAFLSLGRWTPGWGGTGAPSWAPVPTQPGVQLTSACIFGPRRENTAPDYIYCAQRNSFRSVALHAYSHPKPRREFRFASPVYRGSSYCNFDFRSTSTSSSGSAKIMVRVTSTSTSISNSGQPKSWFELLRLRVQVQSKCIAECTSLWKVCEGFCSGMALRRAPAEMHVDAIHIARSYFKKLIRVQFCIRCENLNELRG